MTGSQPRGDDYDVVVIGSGLGGLGAAALLARSGRSVLVAEQAPSPGGYAACFRRGDYILDPAVHRMPQGHRGGLPYAILEFLGVDDQVELRLLGSHYQAVFPDRSIHLPFGFDAYVEAHCEAFPGEAEGLRKFFDVCHKIHKENHELPPSLGLQELDAAANRFPTLFGHIRSTVSEVLDEYIESAEAKAACTALVAPPREPSVAAVVRHVRPRDDHGDRGQLLLRGGVPVHGGRPCGGPGARRWAPGASSTAAERILVEDGRVTGVQLAGGEAVRARVVISNADARETFEDLIGEDHLPPRLLKRLNRMQPSASAVVITAATSLDPSEAGVASEVFRPLHYDHDRSWQDIKEGRPGGMWMAFPSLEDPSLAPPGEQVVIMSSLASYDAGKPWKDTVEPFTDQMLDAFEHVVPGLRDSLTFTETATPETFHRFTRNQGGAIYGWESTPNQSGGRRSPNEPPVEGLFLAGHWTQPGRHRCVCWCPASNAADKASVSGGWGPLGFSHTDRPPV